VVHIARTSSPATQAQARSRQRRRQQLSFSSRRLLVFGQSSESQVAAAGIIANRARWNSAPLWRERTITLSGSEIPQHQISASRGAPERKAQARKNPWHRCVDRWLLDSRRHAASARRSCPWAISIQAYPAPSQRSRGNADSKITQRSRSHPSTASSRSPEMGGRDQSERLVAIIGIPNQCRQIQLSKPVGESRFYPAEIRSRPSNLSRTRGHPKCGA
jgi:hypothetical protein